MKFQLDGTKYEFDSDKLMFSEMAAIQRFTGMTYPQWIKGWEVFDTFAVMALCWVSKKHAGEDVGTLETFEAGLGTFEAFDDDEDETPTGAALDPSSEPELAPEPAADSKATTTSSGATT